MRALVVMQSRAFFILTGESPSALIPCNPFPPFKKSALCPYSNASSREFRILADYNEITCIMDSRCVIISFNWFLNLPW
jgi:hypothetical protein